MWKLRGKILIRLNARNKSIPFLATFHLFSLFNAFKCAMEMRLVSGNFPRCSLSADIIPQLQFRDFARIVF